MPPQHSAEAHSRAFPVRSTKGGYLRCPFDISTAFAELAERHVRVGANTTRGRQAVEQSEETAATDEPRPWTRAGVGASKLTATERRSQREQSERIYGKHESDVGPEESADPKEGAFFAADTREKEALMKVVPRHIRRKHLERNSGESNVDQILRRPGKRDVRDDDDDLRKTGAPSQASKRKQEEVNGTENVPSKKTKTEEPNPSASASRAPSRMQQMEAMRLEALYGGKRGKRR